MRTATERVIKRKTQITKKTTTITENVRTARTFAVRLVVPLVAGAGHVVLTRTTMGTDEVHRQLAQVEAEAALQPVAMQIVPPVDQALRPRVDVPQDADQAKR